MVNETVEENMVEEDEMEEEELGVRKRNGWTQMEEEEEGKCSV